MGHTHGADHAHDYPHTHTKPAQTITASCASAGAHVHPIYYAGSAGSGSEAGPLSSGASSSRNWWDYAGDHSHTLSTGEIPDVTVNTQSSTTTGATAVTASTVTVNTGSNTAGAAHNNMQPYITCYIWKRTA